MSDIDKKRDIGSQKASERAAKRQSDMPAAGPHAKPELTNDEATPGAGTLPGPEDEDSVSS